VKVFLNYLNVTICWCGFKDFKVTLNFHFIQVEILLEITVVFYNYLSF